MYDDDDSEYDDDDSEDDAFPGMVRCVSCDRDFTPEPLDDGYDESMCQRCIMDDDEQSDSSSDIVNCDECNYDNEVPKYVNSFTCDNCGSSESRKDDIHESVPFDKFMDKILINEGVGVIRQKQEDSPQRIRAARHQDRPLNKIRYGVKQ